MCCQERVDICTVIYYGRVASRDTVTVPCVWWSRTWILASQVSTKVTPEWELSFLTTKKRTLVTLKILFFVEQENAWDFHCAEWERKTPRKCVSLTRDAWDLAGLQVPAFRPISEAARSCSYDKKFCNKVTKYKNDISNMCNKPVSSEHMKQSNQNSL